MDNPSLTTRLWKGPNPIRILIDRHLEVPKTHAVFSADANTIVFTGKSTQLSNTNVKNVEIDFEKDVILQLLQALHNENIQSLIVEGGKITLQSFIDLGLWDEARVFRSHHLLHQGTKAPDFKAKVVRTEMILDDELRFYANQILCD
jgi:diaminohydroxyphosphoribosylaminopyrimidine deaminase/5-amino-6-(5-phosphoribosylamino)uracil reductase